MWVCDLGTIDYRSALALQERVRAARQDDLIPDTLLLLEHWPRVYTRGRRSGSRRAADGRGPGTPSRGSRSSRPTAAARSPTTAPASSSATRSCASTTSSRTCARSSGRWSPRCARTGIAARARPEDGPDYTGVWVEDRKIASIGVHVARGVTTHGFAVNVENDLQPFTWVVACGLPSVQMTSIEPRDAATRRSRCPASAGGGVRAGRGARPAPAARELEPARGRGSHGSPRVDRPE